MLAITRKGGKVRHAVAHDYSLWGWAAEWLLSSIGVGEEGVRRLATVAAEDERGNMARRRVGMLVPL